MGTAQTLLAQDVIDLSLTVMGILRETLREETGGQLRVGQMRILKLVERTPEVSPSDLAEQTGLTCPAVSHLVDGLVERGWLERWQREDDRRRVAIRLTAAGQTALDQIRAAADQAVAERLATLSEAERRRVAAAVELLRGECGLAGGRTAREAR